MIKSSSKFKLAISLFLLSIFVFGVFGFIEDSEVWHAKNANAQSCKGPADVILVVDRSATMADDLKFSSVKSACDSFIYDLFATTPDVSYYPYDYHQIGLVAFNNNIDSEQLNKSGSYMQGIINNCDGILGENSYPSGYRQTSIAIQRAKEELDSGLSPTNSSATKTMIVLTDGPPHYNIPLAKTNADIAKSNGVRIVSVGLKLDEIVDSVKRAEAEDFIKYIASTPSDCYYASSLGNELTDCTSISEADLETTLTEVYNNITASICDESLPSLNIYRTPQGTLYNVDELLIKSVASDNVGFKSHTLIWSDNYPADLINIECADLSGATIECDTGEIGPFSPGEIINYHSIAVDSNDNEGYIGEPNPRGVTVASVSLNVPSLFRNTDNTISVNIFDPNGKANFDDFYITVDTPILAGVEIEKAAMSCSWSGSDWICVYAFNPDCSWTNGITDGLANNIDVNIYIYADSDDMDIRQIASAENQPLVSYFEGPNSSYPGTCSDGINNDCDYTDSNPSQPIIDLAEMLCDTGAPIVGISRIPSGDVYDDDTITFTSSATDPNGIKQHTIYYRENGGLWQIAFDCNDAGADSVCDEDISQNIASVSATIGPFAPGIIVEYYSTAIDYSGNNNTNSISIESFVVRNRECEGVGDLGPCNVTPGGKCCGGVCNAVISNPDSYDPDCAEEICGDDFVYEEEVWTSGEYGNAISFDGVDDYVEVPHSASLDITGNTVSCAAWVYIGNQSDDIGIIAKGPSVNRERYMLGIQGDEKPRMRVYTGSYTQAVADNPLSQNEWHYLVGTYDGSEIKIYVDGNLAKSVSKSGNLLSSSDPVVIGRRVLGDNRYYNGLIDETRVYNRVLSLEEISDQYDGTFADSTGLVGYWDFDESSGVTAYDNSGNSNNGTLMNFPIQIVKSGILWQWGFDNGVNGAICSDSGNSDGCYAFSDIYGSPPGVPPYFFDGGCEERGYTCSSGFCTYSAINRNEDRCIEGTLVLNDYECVSGSCALSPNPALTNEVCDLELDSLSINAYNSDGVLISGSSGYTDGEVLDNLTTYVSLRSVTDDLSGISEQKIYWRKSADANFNISNCDVSTCGDTLNPCNCTDDIGPFVPGEIVEFFALSKDDSVNHTESIEAVANGLRYYYYDGTGFNTYLGSDIDTDINHTWGSGQVSINGNIWENQSSTVSIIWEGAIVPNVLGTHTFYIYSDDGIRFDIDGNRLIDHWGYSSSEYSATYNFTSLDPVSIRIEWYEGCGAATLRLGWEEPGGAKVYPIPTGNLITPYSFTVRDHECYFINSQSDKGNEPDLTTCDSGNGMCCGGSCDSSISSTSFDVECRVNFCSGTNWVYAAGNEGVNCGSADSCFDYYSPNISFYSGCITGGNKCSSGQCAVVSSSTSTPLCSGDLLTNYACTDYATGTCQPQDSNIDCSNIGNYDSDSVDCNCDCNGYDREEKVYSSLSFDGMNDYVEVPDDASLNPEEITLEAWVYPTNFNYYGNIINKRYPDQYILRFYSTTGRVQGYIYNGGWRSCTTSSDVAASLNQWNHIVHTYDGTIGRVYVNNVEGCTYSYAGAIDSGTSSLKIGTHYTSSNPQYRVEGMIDDVRIYDRALYPEEVQDQYNGIFADDTGLIGHWDFDEGSGEIVGDSSGNGNDGSLSNVDGILGSDSNEPNWETGVYGSGLDFDGDDYVNLNDLDLSTSTNSKVSVEFWMNWSGGNSQMPFGWDSYDLWFYGGNFGFNTFNSDIWGISSSGLSNEWTHIIAVFNNGDVKLSELYLNGDKQSLSQRIGNTGSRTVSSSARISGYSGGSGFRFGGLIDEVRVYNRAVSEQEAEGHYHSVFSNNTNLVGYWNLNENSGTIAYDSSNNGPQWTKYYHGSVSGISGNVPINWQVCTDGKNNDCDEVIDDYDDGGATGISNCDGEVDAVFVEATAMNRECVVNPTCIERSDLFSGNLNLVTYDIDIERIANDFTISTSGTTDTFSIQQTIIEWTTDNWANKSEKVCNNTGSCKVCVEGGTCGEENDLIPSSSLSAGNTFNFRVCAWDGSINNNKKCTDYHGIIILSSNLVPVITPLSVQEPNFCAGLNYELNWNFVDPDDGQASYEIQVREDNDFENAAGLVIDAEKYVAMDSYLIPDSISSDFVVGKNIEYGKTYYWRVRVTDNRSGGYEQTTEWIVYDDPEDPDEDGNNQTFTTPGYKYPQIDFSAIPDYTDPTCLFDIGQDGTSKCSFGEDIVFLDNSVFIECDSPDSSQCVLSDKSRCDISTNLCSACTGLPECLKFGVGYWCDSGTCSPPIIFDCVDEDNNCKMADSAKCDGGICVLCDNDSQCTSVASGYTCQRNGICENPERREWYLYSNYGGVPDSNSSSPVNNYIKSVTDSYFVTLGVKDIFGNSCFGTKKIFFDIETRYPKWNETFPSSPN